MEVLPETRTSVTTTTKGRTRSKSFDDTEKLDPEFTEMLMSKKVDALSTSGKVVKEEPTPSKITYKAIPDPIDYMFENIVNILLESILPVGCGIMGGTAYVWLSKQFGKSGSDYYLTQIDASNGESYSFTRDIDIILPNSYRASNVINELEMIGKVEITSNTRTNVSTGYYGEHLEANNNMRQISRVTTIILHIPLRLEEIKKSNSGPLAFFVSFMSAELFEKLPEKLSIKMDIVETITHNLKLLREKWYVTNELRMYGILVKRKPSTATESPWTSLRGKAKKKERDIVPFPIATMLPSSLTNYEGTLVISLIAMFDYLKGLSWCLSPVPGYNRSGTKMPPTTTKPLKIETQLDTIVRISQVYSGDAVIHEAIPDIWIPHMIYDPSITKDQILKTFNFGKMTEFASDDERNVFKQKAAQRVFEHINAKDGTCMWCMDKIAINGVPFVALPCGCSSSVMHLDCFMENRVNPMSLKMINRHHIDEKERQCELCKKVWWNMPIPIITQVIKFRTMNSVRSHYYRIEDLMRRSIFQIRNFELYEKLMSNPKLQDVIDTWE